MSGTIEIAIDRTACMGSGVCMVYAPNTFGMDDEGKAVVASADGDPVDEVRTAASACPTSAIAVAADRTNGV